MPSLAALPAGPTAKRWTSISRVLQTIQSDVDQGAELFARPGHAPIHLLLAADRKTRERAYRLAYRLYERYGYAGGNAREMVVSPFDADTQTLTLLATEKGGADLATISLNLDSQRGLPCDDTFDAEVNAFRTQGLRLAEVTRLALDASSLHSKPVLIRLFHAVYAYAFRLHGVTDLVIEVNPRHFQFYKRLMDFEVCGPERACPRVHGAPAVLLKLDLTRVTRRYSKTNVEQPSPGAAPAGRFYAEFPTAEEERAMLRYLADHHRPMSPADAAYFGVAVNVGADRSKGA